MLEAGIVTLSVKETPAKKETLSYALPPEYDQPVYETPAKQEEKKEDKEEKIEEKQESSKVDSSKITDVWLELIDSALKDKKMQLSSALKSAAPVANDGVFVIIFDDDKKFLKSMVDNYDNAKYIEKQLKQITGNDYTARFVLRSESSLGDKAPKKVNTHSLEELAQKFPDIVTIEEE